MKISKKLGIGVLSLGVLFSAAPAGFAAEVPSKEGSTQETLNLSELSSEQLAEYNSLKSEGYIVSVLKDDSGIITLNGYKPVPSVASSNPGSIGIQAVVGDQTFSVRQAVYNGYTYMTTITGNINVEYIGSTVYPRSDSLKIDRISVGGGPFKSYSAGNPGKVTMRFTLSQKVGYTVRNVPFEVYFKISNTGKLTFSNPVALK
ncbi:hypothetical protein ACFRCQ_27390 [Cytobacillus firmus]|uniref:hypothetical protein n=1 Tax=Cytobacillus firmus TaxID=1399 RepID=UPI0036D15005